MPAQPSRFPVPQGVPGRIVSDPNHRNALRGHLAKICGLERWKFPGAQPVSFLETSLRRLEAVDYWVCEKSDGIRVLALIVTGRTTSQQEFYFIDRKEEFYGVEGLVFPHQDGPNSLHSNTVLDGELVIDVDPRTGQEMLRFLVFDILVLDSELLTSKPLGSRYGRLKAWVIGPHLALLNQRPHLRQRLPFEVKLKPMELAYGIEKVLKGDLPRLTHGSDGLIFTSAEAQYCFGTDDNIMKWKPPFENSIDFRLDLRFPAISPTRPHDVDFMAKPTFVLMMNVGHGQDEYFDTLEMSDDEWDRWKQSREQLDDRIVEVVWDPAVSTWRILRFRDDKREGNFRTVVTKIIDSIRDGVEADQLIGHAPAIRQAWKARQAARGGPPLEPAHEVPARQPSVPFPPPERSTTPPPPPQQSSEDDDQPKYALARPSVHRPVSGVAATLNR